MGHGERAELDTEEFLSESAVLENFIILRPNPNYVPERERKEEKVIILLFLILNINTLKSESFLRRLLRSAIQEL